MVETPLSDAADVVDPTDAAVTLRRLHGWSGLLALGGYTWLHLWHGRMAFSGREAWVERVTQFPLANGATVVVLAGLGVHVLLGLLLRRAPDPVARLEAEGAVGLRRLQQGSGLVLLAFLAVHLVQALPLSRHDPVLAREGFTAVRLWVETPVGLAFYITASTALAFHWAHGISRMAASQGWVGGAGGLRIARWIAGVLGLALWAYSLQWVGLMSNGVGLWPLIVREPATGLSTPESTQE